MTHMYTYNSYIPEYTVHVLYTVHVSTAVLTYMIAQSAACMKIEHSAIAPLQRDMLFAAWDMLFETCFKHVCYLKKKRKSFGDLFSFK